MTKPRLQTLKTITTWGGVIITLSGIAFNFASGGSALAFGISLSGVLITCSGHWISFQLDRLKAAERATDEERFAEMEFMSDYLNKAGVFDNPEDLRRMIRKEASWYADEHQDDGR